MPAGAADYCRTLENNLNTNCPFLGAPDPPASWDFYQLYIFCRFLCISFIVGLKHAGKTFDIVESNKFVFGDISHGAALQQWRYASIS